VIHGELGDASGHGGRQPNFGTAAADHRHQAPVRRLAGDEDRQRPTLRALGRDGQGRDAAGQSAFGRFGCMAQLTPASDLVDGQSGSM
jgi:hypothetical protein